MSVFEDRTFDFYDRNDRTNRLKIRKFLHDDIAELIFTNPYRLFMDYNTSFAVKDNKLENKTQLFNLICVYKDYLSSMKVTMPLTTVYDFIFKIPEFKQFEVEFKEFERLAYL